MTGMLNKMFMKRHHDFEHEVLLVTLLCHLSVQSLSDTAQCFSLKSLECSSHDFHFVMHGVCEKERVRLVRLNRCLVISVIVLEEFLQPLHLGALKLAGGHFCRGKLLHLNGSGRFLYDTSSLIR